MQDDQRSASEWAAENRARWLDNRLQTELDDLRARYFPDLQREWRMRAVVIPTESDAYRVAGQCLRRTGEIVIDLCVPRHRSVRTVRSTMLHELCHAAVAEVDMNAPAHGLEFFREVERILALGAPIREGFFYIDASHARVAEIVADLPLCRSRYQRQVARRLKVRSSS